VKTVLLVIDAQVGLLEGSSTAYRKDEVLTCIESLLKTARHRDREVIYVMDDDVGREDASLGAIHPRIVPMEWDTVLHKTSTSSFFRTGLDEILKAKGIEHLIIAGCKTEYCIDTACRHAIGLGYQVTLVADGHSTTANGVLSSEQIVAHHNRNLDGLDNHEFMIRVLPMAEVEW
jgi:nicotinamidase-related amidase